ncbi:LacI family DNA-binding transcriptional regulator [Flexivirga alba]|uniref:LacI family DNA-binding transcriptional regulator n=1 Tax=Flexivirga alba TaxID=702742 RepID=A0ABW2ADY0_9MICO
MPDKISVVDVAREAGVSLGTVSNVLNRPDRVSPATRERVQQVIESLGYVRNEAARQLRSGSSRTIGLVVLDIANPFFTDVAKGAEEVAEAAGLSVVLCNSGEDRKRETHHLNLLREQRAFGVLVTPVAAKTPAIEEIRRSGTPVVLVDRGSGRAHCSVSVNDRVGGELAVAHLLAVGHQRICFVGGPRSIRQVGERLAGARAAFSAAGLDPAALQVISTPALNVAEGRTAGAKLAGLHAGERPTAVFCANDLLGLGILQEMTLRRLRVPDDLAIIGYDDIDFAEAAAIPMSSVRQPRTELGRTATQLLVDERQSPTHQHRQVVFEPELVVRASTAGLD